MHRAQNLLLMHGPMSEAELRSYYHQSLYFIARHGVMTLEGARTAIANSRSETPLYLHPPVEEADAPATDDREPTLMEQATARYTVPTEAGVPEPPTEPSA